MDNGVVMLAVRALVAAGAETLRFNFRGVGASDGEHDEATRRTARSGRRGRGARCARAGAPAARRRLLLRRGDDARAVTARADDGRPRGRSRGGAAHRAAGDALPGRAWTPRRVPRSFSTASATGSRRRAARGERRAAGARRYAPPWSPACSHDLGTSAGRAARGRARRCGEDPRRVLARLVDRSTASRRLAPLRGPSRSRRGSALRTTRCRPPAPAPRRRRCAA